METSQPCTRVLGRSKRVNQPHLCRMRQASAVALRGCSIRGWSRRDSTRGKERRQAQAKPQGLQHGTRAPAATVARQEDGNHDRRNTVNLGGSLIYSLLVSQREELVCQRPLVVICPGATQKLDQAYFLTAMPTYNRPCAGKQFVFSFFNTERANNNSSTQLASAACYMFKFATRLCLKLFTVSSHFALGFV